MSAEQEVKSILIVVSGSGGHILPGRYFATAFLEREPTSAITFIGSGRPIEETLIDQHGYARRVINIGGLRRLGFKGLISWFKQLPGALWELQKVFKECEPDLVIGFGGYATVLPVIFAFIRRVPTWIHEAECEPGWANRLLSFFASKISVSRTDCRFVKSSIVGRKVIVTGQPLDFRLEDLATYSRILHEPPRVLITGGSQGAEFLDNLFGDNYEECSFSILHQCRQVNFTRLNAKALEFANSSIKVVSFIDDMAEALRWCDVLVCRGGANAIRDAIIAKVPTIVVPLPGSPEQQENAQMIPSLLRGVLIEEESLTFSVINSQIASFMEKYDSFLAKMLEPEESCVGGTARLVAAVRDYMQP